MSLIAFFAAAVISVAPGKVIDSCPWADRGLDRFGGDLVESVDNYTSIPVATRRKLQAKMASRKYDDMTHLTATGNTSDTYVYGAPTYMHFGTNGRICRTVDISKWAMDDPGERGLVYCEDGHCVVVWTVCRNLSLIERIGPRYPASEMSIVSPEEQPRTPDFAMSIISEPPPAEVSIPPIVAEAELPPVSFASQLSTEPRSQPDDDYLWISASQTFHDLWGWRLLPPLPQVALIFEVSPTFVRPPASIPSVPGLNVDLPPVPGVFPVEPSTPLAPTGPSKTSPGAFEPDGEPIDRVAEVPEPATWFLMACGLGWAVWSARKSKSR